MGGMKNGMEIRTTVLVVEDHEDSREMLEIVLSDAGFHVFSVATAAAALERLRAGGVHFMITDFNLEGGSTGAWLLDKAAEEGLLDDVGAILYSAYPNLRAPDRLSRVLVHRKPIDIANLLGDVRRGMERPSCRGVRILPSATA